MIKTFADARSRDIFDGVDSKAARAIPKNVWAVARRKLDMLNAAHEVRDLASPPANRLEKLQGELKGLYSIRVNDQFRIVFAFANGVATDVRVTDYH